MHDLRLSRFSGEKNSTLGMLHLNARLLCFIIEDQFRSEKVYGETRIPEGRYKLEFRTHGGFHNRYLEKFADMHKGMIQVMDVPGFTDILFHIGNTHLDTFGCLLVADTIQENITGEGFAGKSTTAYKRIYPILTNIMQNDDLHLNVVDYQKELRTHLTAPIRYGY